MAKIVRQNLSLMLPDGSRVTQHIVKTITTKRGYKPLTKKQKREVAEFLRSLNRKTDNG